MKALTLLAAVLLILLFPYLLLALRRVKMALKMRRACRANGHRLVPLHFLWFWGFNFSPHPDFLVRTKDGRAVYTVKLFGAAHRLSNLYFVKTLTGETECFTRRVIPLAGRFPTMLDEDLHPIPGGNFSGVNFVHDSRRRVRRAVDYASPTEGERTANIPVLLVNPAPLAVRASEEIPVTPWTVERRPMFTKKTDRRLESVTVYDGGLLHLREYVFSASGFIRELEDGKLPKDYGIF